MKSKRNERKSILVLGVALLLMAVGFATYSATLYIGGQSGNGSTVTVKKTDWSVHYDTETGLTESASTIPVTGNDSKVTTHTLGDTDFTFEVTLSKPGDKYVAQWNIINDGDYDAVLNQITMSTLTSAQQNYLNYSISYDGTVYTSTTANNLNLELAAGASKTVILTLEYKKPAESSQLPSSDDTIIVSGNFSYTDKQ